MRCDRKTWVLVILLLFVSTQLLWANSGGTYEHEESGEIIEISVLSGLVTFILLVSTVTAGRLMKKGKIKVATHHKLAYITVVVALAHGIYNFLTH